MTEGLLSPAMAAAYIEREWHLKVSAGTVRRWVDDGALPAERAGRRRLIDPKALHTIFDAPSQTSHD